MVENDVHELTAAYALDALSPDEQREYEEHLGACPRCREELAELREAAGALAFGVAGPAPPPALRGRIIDAARAERRPAVVPLRPTRTLAWAGAAAAAAAIAVAVPLGLWANSLSDQLDRERLATEILADPTARSVGLEGASGRLVVAASGEAALVVYGLDPAPSGKTYEVWVIENDRPRPAGLFDGEDRRDVVLLSERVPAGASVSVTLEPDRGADAPTGSPLFSATIS
jgi:anti-sigma factor RsiW